MNKTGSPEWFNEKAQEIDYVRFSERMEGLRVVFYDRFSPDKLKRMSGEELLEVVFGNRKDSMIKWLMFDPEYRDFGAPGEYNYLGIVYETKENGWKYRAENNIYQITKSEAVEKAEQTRDKLLECINCIRSIEFKTIKDYEMLEEKTKAIYFYNYAWVIKYYQMIFPYLFPGMYSDSIIKRTIEIIGLKYHGNARRLLNVGELALFIRRCDINNIVFNKIYSDKWDWAGSFYPCEAAEDNIRLGKEVVCKKDYPYYRLGQLSSIDTKEYSEKVIEIERDIDAKNLTGSDREAVVRIRVNQGVFRELLLRRYKKCCLCGVSEPKLLVASHIKPWSESEALEKLDVDNGFIFCPNHDRLFDGGWISFADDGSIKISDSLNDVDRVFMNVNSDMKIKINDGNKKYLEFHREKIFR